MREVGTDERSCFDGDFVVDDRRVVELMHHVGWKRRDMVFQRRMRSGLTWPMSVPCTGPHRPFSRAPGCTSSIRTRRRVGTSDPQPVEGGVWRISQWGMFGDRPALDDASFLEFSRTLASNEIHAFLCEAQRVSDLKSMVFRPTAGTATTG